MMKTINSLIGNGMIFYRSLLNWIGLFEPVYSEQQALNIGDQIAKYIFSDIDYNYYKIQVQYSEGENEWVVFYMLKGPNGQIIEHILGGGGPEIHIIEKTLLKINNPLQMMILHVYFKISIQKC